MGIFRRDLHVVVNSGTPITLYGGAKIRVKAMTYVALERLDESFPTWLGRLMGALEKGVAITPAGMDSQIEGLLADLKLALPNWRDALVFILADSNPELGITEEWCRANIHAPDLGKILKAFVEENGLRDLLDALGKKVLTRAATRAAS